MGKVVHSLKELTLPAGNYVLVVPGWYPTWLDAMPGDFNQRHVKAAGLYTPQVVLYVAKDPTATLHHVTVQYHQLNENVAEIIVIYPQEKVKAWDVINSNVQFTKLLYKHAELIRLQFGKPGLLHAYIVLRGGLGAYLLSKKWKLPFVLTENWTIYYPEDPGFFKKRNLVFRKVVRTVFRHVERFLPVTENLQQQAEALLGNIPSTVIPNVVETEQFNDIGVTKAELFRFVHVSTMNYQKNPEGLLRAFAKFHQQHPLAKLWMVGPYPQHVKAYADELKLTNVVHFTGIVSYLEVAAIIKQSHSLVLFSRYENLPCVILEAHCCGLPVISSRVGGIAEVVDDSNGFLVNSGDEQQLQHALSKIYNEYHRYDNKKIAETAMNRFSYEAVGKMIQQVYDELLNSSICLPG